MLEFLWSCIKYCGGSVVLIGTCKWLYVRDNKAVESCLETVCEFRSRLEKFEKHLRNHNRHPDQDIPKLLELEHLLKALRLKKRGLLFKPCFLNRSIQKSLKLFYRLNIPGYENKPHLIAAELTQEWGIPTVSPYEAKKLVELQWILEKPSLFRWAYGIFSWVKLLLDKILFKLRFEKKISQDI